MGIGRLLKIAAFQAGLVAATLSQKHTNGDSRHGTLQAAHYPKFLDDGPIIQGFPWGRLDFRTDYYTTHPNTGVIRKYDFHIHRAKLAPDGYLRDMIVINNQYPGPPIVANWGDTIQVTVYNDLDDEGTALHWHGQPQTDTLWEDGVPGITQCPIAPGKSFTYQFVAEFYGSSWYHSHYSAQYNAGLLGPMVIYGPNHYDYDIDLGPVMLSDWYHEDYFKILETVMGPNMPPGSIKSVGSLINGKGNFNCSTVAPGDKSPCTDNAGISKFNFKRGKKHRLRLINTSSEALIKFSIDGHNMTVIATDFVPIESYTTTVLGLGVGQRADVIVEANGELDSYWIRSNLSARCAEFSDPTVLIGLGAIYYDDADTDKNPQSTAWDYTDPLDCANDDISLQRPLMKIPLEEPDLVITMDLKFGPNATNSSVWTMGSDTPIMINYNNPTLLQAHLGNLTFEKSANLFNLGNHRRVRIIINNFVPIGHPIHLHGYNFFVLSLGPGRWDNKTIINPDNPARRDVVQMPNSGYVVIDIPAHLNEGVFFFHCHIVWHSSAGFGAQLLVNPDAVKDFKIPNTVAETCRQWGRYTNTHIPDQIDSGL